MPPDEETNPLLDLAAVITDGDWRAIVLTCPECREQAIVFSFTRIDSARYGLFIECRTCGRRAHFNLRKRPENFSESLVLPEYQRLEDFAVKLALKTKGKIEN